MGSISARVHHYLARAPAAAYDESRTTRVLRLLKCNRIVQIAIESFKLQ